MRKIALLFLLAFTTAGLQAQFNLSSTDMPSVGDKRYYQYADSVGVTAGASGTGQTWDYSALKDSMMPFYLEYVDPSSTSNGSSFPTATVAVQDGAGNTNYYNGSSTAEWSLVGVVSQLTVNQPANYSDPAIIFNLPTTFNTVYDDSLYSTFNALGATAYRAGRAITVIDAEGDITLPDGTVYNDVIRVNSSITTRDSANVFGNTVISTATTTTFTWLNQGEKLPVFTISRVTGDALGNPINETQVYYAAIDTTTGINDVVRGDDFLMNVSPNPFGSAARVSLTLKQSSELKADLIDLNGRIVENVAEGTFGAGAHSMFIGGEDLQRGVYFLRVQYNGQVYTRKLVHF